MIRKGFDDKKFIDRYFQYEYKIQNARKRKVTVEISLDGLKVNLKKKKKKVIILISEFLITTTPN